MDETIVKLIKKRDEKGIELLINEYAPLIKAIVKKHLYNLGQYHEECINDVYLGVWNNIDGFDKDKNILKNWVAAITKYKTIDYKRRYLKDIYQLDISEIAMEGNGNLEEVSAAMEVFKNNVSSFLGIRDKENYSAEIGETIKSGDVELTLNEFFTDNKRIVFNMDISKDMNMLMEKR